MRGERGAYLIPLVLHDASSTISIKGVIINLSATGCRVLTNDRRLRLIDPKVIVGKPFLLDFGGDLYGQRLVVELWERLRDERVFESEEALVEQIGRDVEATRAATRPV